MNDAFEIAVKLALQAREVGDLQAACTQYEVASALCEINQDEYRRAFALRHVADLQLGLGHLDEALDAALRAETIYRAGIGGPLDLANSLRLVALAFTALGDRSKALAYWRQAMIIYVELKIADGVAECQAHIA